MFAVALDGTISLLGTSGLDDFLRLWSGGALAARAEALRYGAAGRSEAVRDSRACPAQQTEEWSKAIMSEPRALPTPDDEHIRLMRGWTVEALLELHRLVLTAFERPARHGEQGCHRDGNPLNNALPNLRWGSQAENWTDRKRHGNGQAWAKLSVGDVEEIRACASRIAHLRRTPAAVRFISFEPLLEDLGELDLTGIQQAIVGSESGHGARPMREDWVRRIRDQARAQGVAFFYKQRLNERGRKVSLPLLDGRRWAEMPHREAAQ